MELVVGTYDEVILGFRVIEVENKLQVETSFTDHSHAGCVKCVAISGKGVLASGSSDETIRLLNIKKQKELGSLVHHNGTVTSLEFHKGFLFSTSEDKNLCLWKTFTWECLRTFKGHQAAADCVSVHPSGKLALTVGRDRALHTWNLITGRSAYITNLKQVASIVKWSPDGEKYAIVIGNTVNIYSVETADIILTMKAEASINSLVFLNNEVCCYGGEGGDVIFYDIVSDKQLYKCETGTNRVKCFCISSHNFKEVLEKRILCTVSSDGLIKLYKIIENQKKISTELLIEHRSGFRVTCLAVLGKDDDNSSPHEGVKLEKTVTKHNDNDDGGGSDDDDESDDDDSNSDTPDVTDANKLSRAKSEKTEVKVNNNKTDVKPKNRKRKFIESSKDQQIVHPSPVNKQQKVGKQQKNKKQHEVVTKDDTVSFITAADSRKKKFKKKKKPKKFVKTI
ncbi:p21-activated protein kinase-interacting protein 1-like [Ruditapes philippinarum]|uniref:p21-activated protein kinase-interacting protein 1-like n=1 Tax=Ruditapes philippinarum TaxID=129788 RepID=UPI00295B5217|nr:p21-activated protein kinase-interacting protein 1-like [Ruditapes philippinarum]